MVRLSLNRERDIISTSTVRDLLIRTVYHKVIDTSPTGIPRIIICGRYKFIFGSFSLGIAEELAPVPKYKVRYKQQIKSIGLSYMSEDDDSIGLYIDVVSGPWIVFIDGDAIRVKKEIVEMIERDNAEEFDW